MTGSSNPILGDNLNGWKGVGGGREACERGDIYIYIYIHTQIYESMVDSYGCMAETNTIL